MTIHFTEEPFFASLFDAENVDRRLTALRNLLFRDARVEEADFGGGVYLIDEDRMFLDLQFSWHLSERFWANGHSIPIESTLGSFVAEGRAVYFGQEDLLPRNLCCPCESEGIRSAAVIPLHMEKGVFGMLLAGDYRRRRIRRADELWLATLARHLEERALSDG